jgi:hypothetical protein
MPNITRHRRQRSSARPSQALRLRLWLQHRLPPKNMQQEPAAALQRGHVIFPLPPCPPKRTRPPMLTTRPTESGEAAIGDLSPLSAPMPVGVSA